MSCKACDDGQPCTGALANPPSCSGGSCGVAIGNPPPNTSGMDSPTETAVIAAYNQGAFDASKGKELGLFMAAALGAATVYGLVRWGVIKG